MSQDQHRAMMSSDAAVVGPQVRCFRLAGLTQTRDKEVCSRDKEADHGNIADEKFVHPLALATGELDEGSGKRHGKQY